MLSHSFSKYSPSARTHFSWRSTHFWYTAGYHSGSHRPTSLRAASLSSSSVSNLRSRRSPFSRGNTAKSIGAKSGLYGSWLMRSYPRKSIVIKVSVARWLGALSWWNNNSSMATPDLFFLIAFSDADLIFNYLLIIVLVDCLALRYRMLQQHTAAVNEENEHCLLRRPSGACFLRCRGISGLPNHRRLFCFGIIEA